jgi:predicted dehydrogenase
MPTKKRAVLVGCGGMGMTWVRRFLPMFTDRLEIVAVADPDRAAVTAAGDLLGLPPRARFAEVSGALTRADVSFVIIVTPPAAHRPVFFAACGHVLPVLCEKPIADSWDSSLSILRAAKMTDIKAQIIQNYRYNAPMVTFRNVLRSGVLGQLNYLVARFAADYREPLSWGAAFRHEIPHALLVEGAVHHFDMIRNLSGADCATMSGVDWNPAWSSSKGEFCSLYQMTMTNGVHATYEGSGTAGGEQNSWHDEYYRAECEKGSVTIGRDHVVRIHRFRRGGGLGTEEVPSAKPDYEGHAHQIAEFLDWLDGGPTPETVIDDNIKTTAMVFGAIEASRTGQPVDVAAMVAAGTPE